MAVHGEEPPPSDWIDGYRQTVSRGLAGATAVVAPSRWMLTQIEKHYGRQRAADVIYNGRNPQWFNPHADKEGLVLTVGRLWDAAKQVSLLTECDCSWPVVIAGATEHPDEAYRNESKQIVCEGTLELKGSQTPEQLRTLFSRASIYAATSRYEPFGLALVEAALSRCAIVANDIPSLRELWGETACYFRTDDAGSLRAAIDALRQEPLMRRHQAELAYQRARRRFSADRMVEEYLGLYETLAGNRTAAA
jgi:glycosyltransferase involved in cell wall biosynthesis